MSKETLIRMEAAQSGARLPLFDQIAQDFLNALSKQRNGEASACLDYLDGKVKIDSEWYPRRVVILAVEDLKRQIEAPLPLRGEVYAFMKHLGLDPIPELRLYRDVATAILRIDAALHLSRLSAARGAPIRKPIYH